MIAMQQSRVAIFNDRARTIVSARYLLQHELNVQFQSYRYQSTASSRPKYAQQQHTYTQCAYRTKSITHETAHLSRIFTPSRTQTTDENSVKRITQIDELAELQKPAKFPQTAAASSISPTNCVQISLNSFITSYAYSLRIIHHVTQIANPSFPDRFPITTHLSIT